MLFVITFFVITFFFRSCQVLCQQRAAVAGNKPWGIYFFAPRYLRIGFAALLSKMEVSADNLVILMGLFFIGLLIGTYLQLGFGLLSWAFLSKRSVDLEFDHSSKVQEKPISPPTPTPLRQGQGVVSLPTATAATAKKTDHPKAA